MCFFYISLSIWLSDFLKQQQKYLNTHWYRWGKNYNDNNSKKQQMRTKSEWMIANEIESKKIIEFVKSKNFLQFEISYNLHKILILRDVWKKRENNSTLIFN